MTGSPHLRVTAPSQSLTIDVSVRGNVRREALPLLPRLERAVPRHRRWTVRSDANRSRSNYQSARADGVAPAY
jgi:hypothetical protein